MCVHGHDHDHGYLHYVPLHPHPNVPTASPSKGRRVERRGRSAMIKKYMNIMMYLGESKAQWCINEGSSKNRTVILTIDILLSKIIVAHHIVALQI